ncbi:MAG: hypothetical protein ACTSSI_16075 [Candidatus Helarchaeota archaeon]
MQVNESENEIMISNDHVMMKLRKQGDVITEEYLARKNGTWHVLARTNGNDQARMIGISSVIFRGNNEEIEGNFSQMRIAKKTDEIIEVICTGVVGGYPIAQSIKLFKNQKFFHFTVLFEARTRVHMNGFLKRLACTNDSGPNAKWNFIYIPQLRPKKKDIIGDHVFRSPLIVLRMDTSQVALIPDLNHLNEHRVMKTCLDFERKEDLSTGYVMSFGFQDYKVARRHVYYARSEKSIPIQWKTLEFAFYLMLDGSAVSLSHLTSFMWDKFAQKFVDDLRPQLFSFEFYNKKTMNYLTEKNPSQIKQAGDLFGIGWQTWRISTPSFYRTGAQIIGMNSDVIYFQPWFNNMRTAFGLYYWSKQLSDEKTLKIAQGIKELILLSPDEDGIFHTACEIKKSDIKWMKGTKAQLVHKNFHVADCAITCYWMLQWHEYLEPDMRLLEKCKKFGDFLLKIQLDSGAIPSWLDVKEGQLVIEDDLKESANACSAGLFLSELYRVTKDSRFLDGAKKVAEFTITEVLPQQKWFDYETFFSCSRKKIGFRDKNTGLFPQNNLSIFWAAFLFKNLHEFEQNTDYRKIGLDLLAILSFYQQVWNPPYISIYAFGGFGVMNTDAEWNDARQAIFARLYFEWLDLVDDDKSREEFFQRGIAALRAAFTLMLIPEHESICAKNLEKMSESDHGALAENYGHSGMDKKIPGYLMYDWGAGTASSATALSSILHGDIFFDVELKLGFGINGILISDVTVQPDKITFRVKDKVPDKNFFRLKVRNPTSSGMEIHVNGINRGKYTKMQLEQGIKIEI